MLRRTVCVFSVWQTIQQELGKLPAFLSCKVRNEATQSVNSVNKAIEFMKGNNVNESEVLQQKRKQHRAAYEQLQRQKLQRANEERAKGLANLSWRQKLAYYWNGAKEAYTSTVSTKAGVMALLEACTTSHAAEVAIELGIDVENVQMVLEQRAASNLRQESANNTAAVGTESVVIGYIDAPRASNAEVMEFAEKLQKACPIANNMHIEWRKGSPSERYSEPEYNYNNNNYYENSHKESEQEQRQQQQQQQQKEIKKEEEEEERKKTAERMSFEEFVNKVNKGDPFSNNTTNSSEYVPSGMPGERRGMQYNRNTRSNNSANTIKNTKEEEKKLWEEQQHGKQESDSEKLHLPGMPSRRKQDSNAPDTNSKE